MKRLLLVGAGHTHLEVLRRFGARRNGDAQIVVIDPSRLVPYSGMLPGLIAGHYRFEEIHIDATALAAYAGARFVMARVAALDLGSRRVVTDAGDAVDFDIVSIDVGSTPSLPVGLPAQCSIPVKPVSAFVDAWNGTRADVAAGRIAAIAVVGAGAGGVESLLSMQHALRALAPIEWHLIADSETILPQHARAVRERLRRVLARRGVVVHTGAAAVASTERSVRLADGTRVPADRVVWTTSASAQRWPRDAGLATDDAGFIAVDETLRSCSHPFVFAAGDCATQIAHPRPKSGVFAVRQGPPLARNLRRALRGESPRPFVPQRLALALISTGDRCAIAAYGPFAIAGRWVWRWKSAIDRRFVGAYHAIAARAVARDAAQR